MSTSEAPQEGSLGLGWEVAALAVMLSFAAVSALVVVAIVGGGVEPVTDAAFTTAVPPALEPTRVAIGIGVALVLGAIALSVIRTTDWRVDHESRPQAAEEVPHLLGGP